MNKHGSVNRMFRLIFNEALGAWVPVAETVRARGKRSRRGVALLAPLIALSPSIPAVAGAPPAPTTLPTGGTVVAGSATLTGSSTSTSAVLNVDQTSQRAVIDWNTFNLGSAAQVNFVQPGTGSATLNEVLSTNPSQIFGKITGNGQVFLVNPNGVLFGKSASVDVGSLTATTNSISNADFMAGNLTFNRNGADGSVVNEGTLHAGIGGYIALLAPNVRNSGVVVARMGTVALAAGDAVTLNFDGTHLAGIRTTPSTIAALVQNKSAVIAPGGLIILSALALDQVQGGVVNNSGTLEATGMSSVGGRIVLDGGNVQQEAGASMDASGTSGGSVQINAADISLGGAVSVAASGASGHSASRGQGGSITLTASNDVTLNDASLQASGATSGGQISIQGGAVTEPTSSTAAPTLALQGNTRLDASSAAGRGGTVAVSADRVGLFDTTSIDASGATGGGTVSVGGGLHGEDTAISDAQQTVMAKTTRIDASALGSGAGGQVAVWSNGETSFAGNIEARGGDTSGAGGFVEVSSKGTLNFLGDVDASAPHGVAGTLLLDPQNIDVISGGSATLTSGQLAFATNTGVTSNIDPNTITALTNAGTAVTLQANTDLTIASAIITSASGTAGALTFQAGRSIAVNASVISDNANVTFSVNDANAVGADRLSGTATFANNSVIDAGSGNVSITMGTFAGATGGISAGHISAGSLSITQNGPTGGAVNGAIDLGETDLTGNLTINANTPTNVTNVLGAQGASGAVIVRGTTTMSVGTGSVTINGPNTDFNVIGVTAGNVTLNDTNAMQFGTSVISGNLTETAAGPIASTGAVQVTGLTTLTANSGGFGYADPFINLSNSANHFAGGLVLDVPSAGYSGTGGYANIRDSGALAIDQSTTASYLNVAAGGAVTLGVTGPTSAGSSIAVSTPTGNITTTAATTAGSTVTYTTSSGTVTTGSTSAADLYVTATGAVSLGASAIAQDLTVSNNASISDTGVTTVGRQTTLTAGSANNITFGSAGADSFNYMRIVSGNNVSLTTANGVDFGNWNAAGGWTSTLSGNLNITSGGNIQQVGQGNSGGYSAISVAGTTTFTANGSAQIQLLLGSTNPFNSPGQANLFTGGVTLATASGNTHTGFNIVEIRDTNSAAVVLAGLTSVGTLSGVYLDYDNAPSISLPGMTVTGALDVYGPSVANTGTNAANIISQTGPIVVGGNTIMAAGSSGDIVLNNASNNFNTFGIANTGARNLSLVNNGPLILYAPGYNESITGNLSITANGEISDYANAWSVTGTATLNAGATNPIYFVQNDTWGGAVSLNGDNVTFNPNTGLILGNSSIAGTLSITSRNYGYALTQLAGSAVVMSNTAATTTFNNFSNGITLAQPNNIFGPLAISQAGAITIAENSPISQASAWSDYNNYVEPVTLTTTNSQAITLTQASAYMGNLTITQGNASASSPGAVTITSTADTAGITQGSGAPNAWTTYGTVTLNSGAYSINLNNPNNVLGPLQVSGATGSYNSVPSSVTLYAKGTPTTNAITDVGGTGAWNVGSSGTAGSGVVKLVAYDVTGTTAGGGNIVLDNAGNVLGNVYLKATDATITENASITDGALLSNWDGAGDSGWSVSGAADLIVDNPSGKSITLANTTNLIAPIGITTAGTAGTLSSVLITDNENIAQSSIWNIGAAPITLNATSHQINLSGYGNVLGNISISTANGTPSSVAITENDPITQGATAWALTGVPVTLVAQNGNAITLTDAANVMGNLAITGGAVSITENAPITQASTAGGAWTTTGVTTLDVSASAGSGITLTNAANVLGPIAIAGTPSAVNITENAPITQASAWVQSGTPITLNSGTHDVVLSQAGNQLGALTITAQDAVVTESNSAGISEGGAWTVPGTTTLTAGAGNPINLNTSSTSTFGTVGIVSASNAAITAEGAINFATSTVAAGGLLTVSAGGTITQSGAINAPSLRLIGTGDATLTNAGNTIGTVAAGFSGGDLAFTNSVSFAVGVLGGTTGITIGDANVTLTSIGGTVTGLANVNASSASLSVTTGTALSLPQLSIAGPQTYSAGGSGITLTTNLTSTAAGAITFASPVTLGSDLTVQTTNSPINFDSTLAGANYQLNVNAGSGAVTFAGTVSALGRTSSASPALTLSSGGATFDTTVATNNGLAITGPVTFSDTVTLGDGAAASVFTGLVTLGKAGGMNLSGYNGMSFNDGVLLENGPATIDSNNSPLTFQTAGTVSGPFGLTLDSGTAALNGLNYMGTNLTSLTVTALSPTIPSGGISIAGPQTYTATGNSNITLQGNVSSTAAGTITFSSPVSVGSSLTVASSNSPVVFASTVDGNSNVSATSNLTVNAGSGTTTFTGAVGQVTPLGNGTGAALVLEGSGATTFDGTLQARSGLTATGPVIFDGNVTLANGDTGSTFNAMVTSGGTAGNTLSGYHGMAFDGGLTLAGGPVSVLSNGSTISFGAPVGGAQNLTLNALANGTGTVSGLSEIGPNSNLTALNVTGETLSLPSTGLAVAGPMTFTAPAGITVNGNLGSSANPASGAITFMSPVTLATGPVAISDANAAVTFNGTVDGAEPLSINAGTGTVAFNSAVGGSTALTSLSILGSGTTTLDTPSITTSGAQNYAAPVTLAVNTTLTGDDVQFQGPLNGPYALVTHDSGTTTFGGVTQLSSLSSTASAIHVNTASITTTAAQSYSGAVTLGADTTLTGAGINVTGTIDGTHSLNANATSGTLSLNGAVGNATALTSLTANGNAITAAGVTTTGAQSYTANNVSLSADYTTNGAAMTVTGPTTLTGNAAIATTGGNITFAGATSTVNGAYSLTLTAGTGNVVLGAAVGSVTPLTAITDSGYDLTLPDITTVNDLNQTYTALDNITLSQSRTLDAPVSFTADADGNGAGSFILQNGVSLTAANNNLSITAADISLGASSTLSSGSGVMSINATDGRNIYLGGPAGPIAGQMTITGAELSLMSTSGGLNLNTQGAGSIEVNGITAAQSQNVTGPLNLNAQGTGSVSFVSSPSTFHSITVDAPGGSANVGVNLNSVNAPIVFLTPVSVSGASTISSNGGNISFDSTLAVANNLTLNTANGTLSFSGPVGSTQTLTLNLGGGSVSGLGELQNTLTGLTVNATSGITLPAFSIDGPQVYNTAAATLTGNLGGIGITFNTPVTVVPASGTALALNSGTGALTFANSTRFNTTNMTLTGDAIAFGGPVTGAGTLTLQPYTASVNVTVGGTGSAPPGLDLNSAELAELPIGTLAALTIGTPTGTGTLNVAGALNVPATPLTLNGGGGITQSGGAILSGPLTLYAAGNPITLANGANAFGAVAINGTPSALSLTNTLDIDQQGSAAWVLGSAPVSLNAGVHNITLNNAGNTFGTLVLNGDNVQVSEAAAADIGASTVTGNLSVAAAGAINFSGALAATGNVALTSSGEVTQSAPLTIGGNLSVTTTVNAGDVTLSNAGDTVIGNTLVGGNYSLTAGGSVSQAAGSSYQVAGNLTISGSNIVLGGAGNIVGGSTTLSGSTTSTDQIAQAGVITLENANYAGNLTVISESANRSISSAPVSGNAIVLNNAGNAITGSISVSASPPTVATGGSDVQTGINQAPGTSLSVSGVASFTAQASTVPNSGNIDLSNAGNSFGTLVLSGSTVNIANAALGQSTLTSALATGSLTLAAAGGVSQTGAITTPTLSIVADGAVALNNVANQVSTVSVVSGGHPISFVNSGDLSIAGINAGGSAVSLTAGGVGGLTQTAALQNVSALSADAGGSIVLTNADNSIAALNTSAAGTGLAIYNTGALGVAGTVSTAAGDLSVRTTGDLTLGSAGRLEALAGNVVASTEGDGNFINTSNVDGNALVVGSANRWLVYSDTPDLVTGPHTVKNGLTSSFRVYGATYSTDSPSTVTASGNGFIYSHAPGTLTVNAGVNGTATQVYGSTPTATLTYALTGFIDSEDTASNAITGGTATYNTALSNSMNAGTYNILYTGGLTSANYSLTAGTTPAVYTVTPAVLTYTATNASRAYGASNPALGGTVTGFVLGQNTSVLAGSATWTTPATTTSVVGQYAIEGGGYTAANGNYTFTQAPGNATALTVGKATLVITADNDTVTYNGQSFSGGAGVTYAGFVNDESSSVLGGTLGYGGTSQGARNAGTYTITPAGLTSSNYSIAFDSGSLVIGRATLDVTTGNVTKTYNGTLSAAGTAAVTAGTQLFGSDTLSGGTFAFTNANAGNGDKTVTVSGATVNDGNGGGNYAVTYLSNTTSTITPASLTLAAANVTKTYDGTTGASGSAMVVQGTLFHNASNGGAQDSLAGGTLAFTDPNAGIGNKTVNLSGVTVNDGNGGGNYAVTYVNNTTSTINPAELTLVGTIANKTYDGTTAATLAGFTLSGLVGDQTLGASAGTATFSTKNAGTDIPVSISGITLTNGNNGGLATNYVVNGSASATGNIDPKLLNVNATVANKVYDGTTTATLQSYGLSGFVGNETVSAVYTGSAAFNTKDVGNDKPVTITGLALVNGTNGGLASNYAVPTDALGSADITPATLHVAGVVALNTVYSGTTTADINTQSAVLTGVIGSDNVSVGSISGAYLTKDVGTNKPIVTSSFVLAGADAMDYTLVQPTGLTASVTPRPLEVAASGLNKVYDGTTAASVTLTDNAISGDALTLTSTNAFLSKDVGNGKYISVSNIMLGGADAYDYTLVDTNTSTYANITPAALALTVSATGINKVYDGSTAATVTLSDNAPAGDVVDLSYASANFANKNVGNGKTVTVNGIEVIGADAADYTVNSVATTTANITPAPLHVTGIVALNTVYNGTTVANLDIQSAVLAGVIGSDNVSIGSATGSYLTKDVGNGKYVSVSNIALGGVDAYDYALVDDSTSTHANITPATLTVSATGVNKVYDGTTAAKVTLSDSPLAGDVVDLTFSSANFANKNVGTGKSVTVSGITASGADAADYTVNTVASTTANITPATLMVTAVGGSKPYDGNTVAPITLVDNAYAGDQVVITDSGARFVTPTVGNGKTITVSGIEIGGGTDQGNYVLGDTSTVTTGAITGVNASTTIATQDATLAPVVPQRVIIDMPTPPPAVMDFTLPAHLVLFADSAGGRSNSTTASASAAEASAESDAGAAAVSDGIQVSLVLAAAGTVPGEVSVSLPEDIAASGKAFSFALPAELRAAAAVSSVRVTWRGKKLPSWLKYDNTARTFTATGVPAGVLPMELSIKIGERRWTMTVAQR